MTVYQWIKQTFLFYRWITVGIVLAVATGTAVLTGALLMGDCMEYTLEVQMARRLGRIERIVLSQEHFFRADLGTDLAGQFGAWVSPIIIGRGHIENPDHPTRVNHVMIYGVDESFGRFSPSGECPWIRQLEQGIVINESLARRLELEAGQQAVLSVSKVGGLAAEMVLFPESQIQTTIRQTVMAVATHPQFGSFGLTPRSGAVMNVFVSRSILAEWLDQPERANCLLLSEQGDERAVRHAIGAVYQPEDLGLDIRILEQPAFTEIRSRTVLVPDSIGQVLTGLYPEALGVFTYFVNEIQHDRYVTPYSMVSAIGSQDLNSENLYTLLADDEILINEWLADDLRADVGDSITLRYYVSSSGQKLVEKEATFRVHRVIPMMGIGADRTLMPEFPEISDVENCRDWDPGIPIDLERIRTKDEKYWDWFKGTPKAFISLPQARRLWANRFGSLTAVRYPAYVSRQQIARAIREHLRIEGTGLSVENVAGRAAQAAKGTTDFSGLFAGLSMFLIFSSLMLTGMLFYFSMERQRDQIGLLTAMGFVRGRIQTMLLGLGLLQAGLGALLGIAFGSVYTYLLVLGLRVFWSDAIGGVTILFHATIGTLLMGGIISFFISVVVMWISLHKFSNQSARSLLDEPIDECGILKKRALFPWIGVLCTAGAIGLAMWSLFSKEIDRASMFFGSGTLLLLGLLLLCRSVLQKSSVRARQLPRSDVRLAIRSLSRRGGRSVAVLAVMACGVFMVTAVGIHQKTVSPTKLSPASGTGGFTLLAESSIPIVSNLNEPDVRAKWNLDKPTLGTFKVLPLRLRWGEDAGCLNLNRAQQPRLLGVPVSELIQRGSFTFEKMLDPSEPIKDPWQLLNVDLGPDVVPAVGDVATVYWALGLNVGDTLEQLDEKGRPIQLKIVGMISNSVLQGNLMISEQNFLRSFPSVSGHEMFLIDTQFEDTELIGAEFRRSLGDSGLEVISTAEKLAQFNQVENTYLSIFLVLGGLGLLLGTAGLGLVLWLNVLDRRGELAMMRAVGFEKSHCIRLLWIEHGILLCTAVVIGAVSAFIAVGPSIISRINIAGGKLFLLIIVAILVCGWLWTLAAAGTALRGDLISALRNE